MKEIKIDGKTYLLDAEKAISAGFLKQKITLEVGNVYVFPDKKKCNDKIILLKNWTDFGNSDNGWYFGGIKNSLAPWSVRTDSAESVIDYISSNELIFIGNINEAVFEKIQEMNRARKEN